MSRVPRVELDLEIHSRSIETPTPYRNLPSFSKHLNLLETHQPYRNFIETLSIHMDLVEIRMETLSSSEYRQWFLFGLIDFVVECPKIDPIPFFFLILLPTSWENRRETFCNRRHQNMSPSNGL